jgi:hypothetical protein
MVDQFWKADSLRHAHGLRVLQATNGECIYLLAPNPGVMTGGSDWKGYGRAYFIHRKIFEDPSTNRDFILSLDANLA